MGKKYDQLDLDERIALSRLHEAGLSNRKIGKQMGRCHTTIGRELKRNSLPKSGYKPGSADRMAYGCRKRQSRIERLSPLRTHVEDRLAMGWSPEQIAGRLRLDESEHTISHESIYRFIYRPKIKALKLYRYLPRAKASRGRRYFKRRREPIPERMNIKHRPQDIDKREEFGHWEGDLMLFRTQKEGNLLNLVERKSRFSTSVKLEDKRADPTVTAIIGQLQKLPKHAIKSITFDRGGEFIRHQKLKEELKLDVWYCDPHSPWQRGSIENTNGLYRRDLPRKKNMSDYRAEDIASLNFLLNTTPRKVLGFRTPAEVFLEELEAMS